MTTFSFVFRGVVFMSSFLRFWIGCFSGLLSSCWPLFKGKEAVDEFDELEVLELLDDDEEDGETERLENFQLEKDGAINAYLMFGSAPP